MIESVLSLDSVSKDERYLTLVCEIQLQSSQSPQIIKSVTDSVIMGYHASEYIHNNTDVV